MRAIRLVLVVAAAMVAATEAAATAAATATEAQQQQQLPELPETFDVEDIAHLDVEAFAPEANRRALAPTGPFTANDAKRLCVTNSARSFCFALSLVGQQGDEQN